MIDPYHADMLFSLKYLPVLIGGNWELFPVSGLHELCFQVFYTTSVQTSKSYW